MRGKFPGAIRIGAAAFPPCASQGPASATAIPNRGKLPVPRWRGRYYVVTNNVKLTRPHFSCENRRQKCRTYVSLFASPSARGECARSSIRSSLKEIRSSGSASGCRETGRRDRVAFIRTTQGQGVVLGGN